MGMRPSRIGIVLGLLAAVAGDPREVAGQDLPTLLRHARLRRVAAEALARDDLRLPFRPPAPLFDGAPGSDEPGLPTHGSPTPAVHGPHRPWPVDTLDVVSKLERPVFRRRFADVSWAFHQGRTYEPLDTTRTWDLRARLEAHFGPPTQTLAEIDSVESLPAEAIVQFEYWIVINDSIPVLVLDVNGPLDRGLVFATDARFRDRLLTLRTAVLERLVTNGRRAAYADYWFRKGRGEWSVTGFDGASFFDRRIARPDPVSGRPSVTGETGRTRGG